MGKDEQCLPGRRNGKAFPVPPLSDASRRAPGSVGGLHIVPPILLVSHKVQKPPMCVLEKKRKTFTLARLILKKNCFERKF
jgi:hypothetical protein